MKSWFWQTFEFRLSRYDTPTLYTFTSRAYPPFYERDRRGSSKQPQNLKQYYNTMYIVLFYIYAYNAHRIHIGYITILLFLVLSSRSLCICIFSFICTTNWLIYIKFKSHSDKFKNNISYLCIIWGFYLLYKDDIPTPSILTLIYLQQCSYLKSYF